MDYCYRLANVPETFHDAVTSAASSQWCKAMEEEIRSLRENDTFEITALPEGRNLLEKQWGEKGLYAVKLGPNNEETRKARFVAKGYSQQRAIDHHETFSPTARITSINTLMQFVTRYNLTVHQMDVKTAYLNAPIDCELYVEQPEGFEVKSQNGKKLVCRLKKSLYGLKQSGRNWNGLLHSHWVKQGFTQSLVDPCVYVRHSKGVMTLIVAWVDDIIIVSSCVATHSRVKNFWSCRFKMRDLGILSWFLGTHFTIEDNVVRMNQSRYIERLLERFGMENCKSTSTPREMLSNKSVDDHDDATYLADERLYREIVGSLIYVMTATRPGERFTKKVMSDFPHYFQNAH